jgi:hypothetical protein
VSGFYACSADRLLTPSFDPYSIDLEIRRGLPAEHLVRLIAVRSNNPIHRGEVLDLHGRKAIIARFHRTGLIFAQAPDRRIDSD